MAIEKFEGLEFNYQYIKEYSKKFDKLNFRKDILTFVINKL
jgi:hypothetical protein